MNKFKILCIIALIGMLSVVSISFSVDTVEAGAETEKTESPVKDIIDYPEELSAMPCCEGPSYVSLGTYRLTAYCSCQKCCGKWALNRPVDEYGREIVTGSTGERLYAGYSIAVDPNVIPYGSYVLINGIEYRAQDCGYGIDGQCIDIYFDDHQQALNFGMQYADVFLKQ